MLKNLFKKIIKLFIYTAMLPIYWLSYLVPKDKNLWIFGAWFGEKYADNSKYLFEYINKNHTEIKAIWLTNNQNTFELIKKKGYKVFKTYSLKGLFYALRAQVGIISTGLKDINIYTTGNMKIVQLWHGIPLKKIMFDDKITFKHPNFFKNITFLIFPFLKRDFYYSNTIFIATSEEVQKRMSSAFNVRLDKVKVTGYPRNDSFFQSLRKDLDFVKKLLYFKSIGKKIVIYMPTHRREGKLNICKFLFSNLSFLNSRLEWLNCILLVKLHYYHLNEISYLTNENYSNIIVLNDKLIEQDIYNILKLTDILITDYSSVYLDYLLLNKPIIFAPFDLEDYLKNDREFYYNYNEVTPGPKAKNWEEVIKYLEDFIKNPQLYKEEREKIKNFFHKYKDGNSSKRVFQEIVKLISNKY